jgi:hypothetical protein
MKRNQIALIIALLLGGFTFWMVTHRDRSSVAKELRDFAYSDTGSVTKLFLADKTTRSVTLTREKDNSWTVNGKYKARPDAVKNLLRVIHDISVRQPIGNKMKQTVLKQLATGSTKCEIYAGDKLVKQFYVGSETPDMMGTYMLLSDVSDPDDIVNSSEPFDIEIKGFNGYLTPYFFTKESEWRDRTAFHYFAPDIRSIKVEHAGEPENSFIVTQAAGSKSFGLQALNGKPLPFDTIAVKQFISYFGQIGFENFETSLLPATKDSILHSTPAHKITVTDASNTKNEVVMWLKKNNGLMPDDSTAAPPPFYDPDRMFATVNNGQDFVTVQYYVFGKLLQTPEYFMPGRKKPADEKK